MTLLRCPLVVWCFNTIRSAQDTRVTQASGPVIGCSSLSRSSLVNQPIAHIPPICIRSRTVAQRSPRIVNNCGFQRQPLA
ncbi:hypothetical protein BKA93DRAFT_806516 [Sparassis latifolia]